MKIDVEIDGSTHLTNKVKRIDARRDAWSAENGWTVVRFTAQQIKQNVDWCIKQLFNVILSLYPDSTVASKNDIKELLIKTNLQMPYTAVKSPVKCLDCCKHIYKDSLRCGHCASVYNLIIYPRKTKITWPSIEVLTDMLKTSNYSRLGKELGVSGNAIKKRIKRYSTA